MNEHPDLFAAFALLEPTADESARAVSRTRAALLARGLEQNLTLPPTPAKSLAQPADRSSCNFPAIARRSSRRAYLVLTVACLILVFGGLAIFNSSSAFAWNDVIRRMTEAKTLQCVVESLMPDGRWKKSWEMQYDRQRGFVERHYDKQGLARTEINDGSSHWVQRRGQKLVTRERGISAAAQLEKLLNPLVQSRSFQPEPANQEVINGTPCRCLTAIDEPSHSRVSIWIDENQRLRRARIEQMIDGRWVTSSRVQVTYDVDISAVAFKPAFDADEKIVDLQELFDATFPLNQAVHREEQFGYQFAIHDLQRLDDYQYFMVVSFRPTDETRKKLQLRRAEVAGTLFPSLRRELLPPSAVQHESLQPLATARANGVVVSAYLGELRGVELPPMTRARPQFKLNAHAKLWKEFGAFNDILFDVPLPDNVTTQAVVCRSLYDTIATLEAIPLDELSLHDPLDNRELTSTETRGGVTLKTVRKHQPKPSEIPFELFYEHLQKQHQTSHPPTTTEPEGR